MKKNLNALNLFLYLTVAVFFYPGSALSQGKDSRITVLSKQVIEANSSATLYPVLSEISQIYFDRKQYNEFVEYMKSLKTKKKEISYAFDYFIALARYNQLKYLEEKQDWDEYFAKGNSYRDEITSGASSAAASNRRADIFTVYSRLILYKFHRDQDGELSRQALSGLMSSVSEYTLEVDDLSVVKKVAETLLSYGEKEKAGRLFTDFIKSLPLSASSEAQIKEMAENFYREGNIDLSESVYLAFLERMSRTGQEAQKNAEFLLQTAVKFAYSDKHPNSPDFAEQLFTKALELGGQGVFNAETLYLRAYNLEKATMFIQAKAVYLDLLRLYPSNKYRDEAIFKAGMINAYVSHDLVAARENFEKLATLDLPSIHTPGAIYQLGLLSQWQNDLPRAKERYNKLIQEFSLEYPQTVALATQRLKELDEFKPIEYNLKTFLDASIKDEYRYLDMSGLKLSADPYMPSLNQQTEISSHLSLPESGCLQVDVSYLWSGYAPNLSQKENSFKAKFSEKGSKEINLVVVSSTGIVARAMALVDIQ